MTLLVTQFWSAFWCFLPNSSTHSQIITRLYRFLLHEHSKRGATCPARWVDRGRGVIAGGGRGMAAPDGQKDTVNEKKKTIS